MESKNKNLNLMKRKKFFASVGTGLIGFFALRSFPLSLLSKKENIKHVKVEINPLAVSRKKIGDKNA